MRALLQQWRQRDALVDHRIFPFMAALTKRVVVVWPAQCTQELIFFPQEYHSDTPIIHFRWFSPDEDGPLTVLEPLQQRNPLGNGALTVQMAKRGAEHVKTLRRAQRARQDEADQAFEDLRQLPPSALETHQQHLLTASSDDRRWGLQQGEDAELCDANIGEFLHAFTKRRGDVCTAWVQKPGARAPRVWCVSSQMDALLQRDGVDGIKHWGRKLDLSKLELLIVPVNHPGVGSARRGGHWTVLVVRIREGLIQSFDSMGREDFQGDAANHPHAAILERVAQWLTTISTMRRLGWPAIWQRAHRVWTRQTNNYDCGVHTLIAAICAIEGTWVTRVFGCIDKVRAWMYGAIRADRETGMVGEITTVTEEAVVDVSDDEDVQIIEQNEVIVVSDTDDEVVEVSDDEELSMRDTCPVDMEMKGAPTLTAHTVPPPPTAPVSRVTIAKRVGAIGKQAVDRIAELDQQPVPVCTREHDGAHQELGTSTSRIARALQGASALPSPVAAPSMQPESVRKRRPPLKLLARNHQRRARLSPVPATDRVAPRAPSVTKAPDRSRQASLWEGAVQPAGEAPAELFARRRVVDEDDAFAIEHHPSGTYYPVKELLYRNHNGKRFMVRWKGFRAGRGRHGDDAWVSRARLMQDCPSMVLAFERACRFDPMEPPKVRSVAGGEDTTTAELVQAQHELDVESEDVPRVVLEGALWDPVTVQELPATWDTLGATGIRVDPADSDRSPPQFSVLSHNLWRTPRPAPNRGKQPTPHALPAVTKGGRQRQAPERLGAGSVCQHNCERFMECDQTCETNAPTSRRTTTLFTLRYHDGKQWALHAVRTYRVGEWVGEYRGEVLNAAEGQRRRLSKGSTSPSYLLQMGPRFIDAEQYGNALRFINHTCVAPNCRYEQVWVEGYLHIVVIALRPISEGEELTASYGFNRMVGSVCHCGHPALSRVHG